MLNMCLWLQALGPRLIWVSRIGVVVWSIIMGIAMTVVQAANININWLINSIGVFVGGAVPPLIFVLTWRRCNGAFATSGEPLLTFLPLLCIKGLWTAAKSLCRMLGRPAPIWVMQV